MRIIAQLFCGSSLFLAACESQSQGTRSILNAGLGPGNEIKRGSDLDFELRATQHVFTKGEWIAHYESVFAKAEVVVLLKVDSRDQTTCVEVWKAKGGIPNEGETIKTGYETGYAHLNDGTYKPYDPDYRIVASFSSYPGRGGPQMWHVPKDGLLGNGNVPLAEIKTAALKSAAN